MNSTERLPQDNYSYSMPKWMIPYCGYGSGTMSVNGGSTILGPVSGVMKMWYGSEYT